MSGKPSNDRESRYAADSSTSRQRTFARWLAEAGGWELGAIETRRFPDGEIYVRILSDVADKTIDLVCTLARPDDGFLRLGAVQNA